MWVLDTTVRILPHLNKLYKDLYFVAIFIVKKMTSHNLFDRNVSFYVFQSL